MAADQPTNRINIETSEFQFFFIFSILHVNESLPLYDYNLFWITKQNFAQRFNKICCIFLWKWCAAAADSILSAAKAINYGELSNIKFTTDFLLRQMKFTNKAKYRGPE